MSDDRDRFEDGAARRWSRWRVWVVLLLALVVVVVLLQVMCR
jgi:t-SNARE complex subunit (syntaxin)